MVMNSQLRTALGAAYIRAHHMKHGEQPLIFEDDYAINMLTPDEKTEYHDFYSSRAHDEVTLSKKIKLHPPPANDVDLYMRNSPIASEVLTRQRFSEDLLSIAVQSDTSQYVILGAGMDTYALRNPNSKLIIYEVDRSVVQDSKKLRVADTRLPLSKFLNFVPSNFKEGTLTRDLCRAGFQLEEKAFFSWLGVTPYLALQSIQETIAIISDLCSRGSELVFDYTSPDAIAPGYGSDSTIQLDKRLKGVGEPLQLNIRPENLRELLIGTKFQIAEHLTPEKIYSRYLEERNDGYPCPDFVYYVRLVVP